MVHDHATVNNDRSHFATWSDMKVKRTDANSSVRRILQILRPVLHFVGKTKSQARPSKGELSDKLPRLNPTVEPDGTTDTFEWHIPAPNGQPDHSPCCCCECPRSQSTTCSHPISSHRFCFSCAKRNAQAEIGKGQYYRPYVPSF